ncbi:MAG: putative deacylase [Cocleimonas sp.]|jgi:predicted deacylase
MAEGVKKAKKKIKNKAFKIGDVTIKPGERKYLELPLPGLYSHSNIHMPVHVMCGRETGPTLFVSAAVHGDEINGVEIIRRLKNSRSVSRLKGTLITVPVVNVYGFINKTRYLPDRRDLNRFFPGSETGSMASKLAYTFLTNISQRCDYGIDLHTAAISRDNLPQIRAVLANDEIKELSLAFGAPVVLDAPLREGSLRESAAKTDTKILLYEAGEALRFDEISIRAGVSGIINVMRNIGMLPKSRKKLKLEPAIAHSSQWVRASESGILRATNPMGNRINKGDVLGYISDPFGEAEVEIIAPVSGMVIGRTTLPLVHEGEAIFHMAIFDELEEAESVYETFQSNVDPEDNVELNVNEPVIY